MGDAYCFLWFQLLNDGFIQCILCFYHTLTTDAGASRCGQCSHGENGNSHIRSIFLFAACAHELIG